MIAVSSMTSEDKQKSTWKHKLSCLKTITVESQLESSIIEVVAATASSWLKAFCHDGPPI